MLSGVETFNGLQRLMQQQHFNRRICERSTDICVAAIIVNSLATSFSAFISWSGDLIFAIKSDELG